LPPLNVRDHIITARTPSPGMLFDLPATDLREQREELVRTIHERCEMAASLANHNNPAILWCHRNEESRLLTKSIHGAVEIKGSDEEDRKESVFMDFANGNIRALVTKPTIAGFGLNWQHCAHEIYFPSHSYEQYYQAIRRCWRFGQKNAVTVDRVSTEGQSIILSNLNRKTESANRMFDMLVAMMRDEMKITKQETKGKNEEIPSWL